MSLESDIAILRDVHLFEDLTPDQLRLLAFGAEHRRLRKGEILFRADARADAGFVVASGEIALTRVRRGAETRLATFGPGSVLGELALITETRRPATAQAVTDCDVLRVTRQIFRRMLGEYPEIAAGLHDKLSLQLADLTERLAEIEPRFASPDRS